MPAAAGIWYAGSRPRPELLPGAEAAPLCAAPWTPLPLACSRSPARPRPLSSVHEHSAFSAHNSASGAAPPGYSLAQPAAAAWAANLVCRPAPPRPQPDPAAPPPRSPTAASLHSCSPGCGRGCCGRPAEPAPGVGRSSRHAGGARLQWQQHGRRGLQLAGQCVPSQQPRSPNRVVKGALMTMRPSQPLAPTHPLGMRPPLPRAHPTAGCTSQAPSARSWSPTPSLVDAGSVRVFAGGKQG